MTEFLVLRLQGPLMSFGSVAVDENRFTHTLPTRSMLTGLLGNALGWRFKNGEQLNRLQERICFGARLDKPGEHMVDYQNAHIHNKQILWRTRTDGPLHRSGSSYDNIQRWRHYLADAVVSVVLTLLSGEEEPTLSDLSQALRRPARPLFLGRMGCPPAGYVHTGETVFAPSLPEALEQVSVDKEVAASRRGSATPYQAEWDAETPLAGQKVDGQRIIERADLRDWVNDIHVGRRLIASGSVFVHGEGGVS